MTRLLLVFPLLLLSHAASAQQFWRTTDLLADMFATSERVGPVTLQLDDAGAARFQAALGYAPPKHSYTFYVATTGGHVDGYALVDDQLGKHEPITFAVQLTPQAKVVRQEVVVYREKYGHEVRHPRFRRQFVGKGPGDELRLGREVDVISGATYSCRSMSVGVQRAILLAELLIAQRDEVAAAP